MYFKNAISLRLLELCNKYNYSPNLLAELSGISPSTLNDVINLKVEKPNSYMIYLLCRTLNIPIKEFFNSPLFDYDNLDN